MLKTRYPVNISKSYLFKLSVPLFFANLAIPLVSIIDTGLMGHLSTSKYLAATSISTSVLAVIFWSFGFLRMGTVGLISQALGKSDYREISKIIIRNLTIAFIISLFIILSKNFIIYYIDVFFQTSEETKKLIAQYISVRVFSAPAELVIYVLVGFYLGIQKTRVSSLLIIIFSSLNILFSSYFVLIMDLKIYGVAIGTVLSAYITIIIFLTYTYYFIHSNFQVLPKFKKIFDEKKIFQLLNINFNIFIRTLLLTFSFLWLTYQGSKLGEDYLAINSILLQFILIASFFLDAYAFSTEGVIGFAVGRKVKKTFLNTVRNCFELSFMTSIFISIFYIIFSKFLINALTDLEYIRFLAYGYIFWIVLIPCVASFCYQFDGIFVGATQTAEMRNSMIISVLIFLLLSNFLTKEYGNHGLWFSFLIFMILRSLTLKIYFYKIMKKF